MTFFLESGEMRTGWKSFHIWEIYIIFSDWSWEIHKDLSLDFCVQPTMVNATKPLVAATGRWSSFFLWVIYVVFGVWNQAMWQGKQIKIWNIFSGWYVFELLSWFFWVYPPLNISTKPNLGCNKNSPSKNWYSFRSRLAKTCFIVILVRPTTWSIIAGLVSS